MASGVDAAGLATGKWRSLPRATVTEFDAVDSLSSFYPMEVIATRAETEALVAAHPGAAYLLFPEDRTRPIKMRDYPVVQGGVLYVAVAFSIVNLLVDLLYAFVDPRIKAQYR